MCRPRAFTATRTVTKEESLELSRNLELDGTTETAAIFSLCHLCIAPAGLPTVTASASSRKARTVPASQPNPSFRKDRPLTKAFWNAERTSIFRMRHYRPSPCLDKPDAIPNNRATIESLAVESSK